jgi:hypothetical protein
MVVVSRRRRDGTAASGPVSRVRPLSHGAESSRSLTNSSRTTIGRPTAVLFQQTPVIDDGSPSKWSDGVRSAGFGSDVCEDGTNRVPLIERTLTVKYMILVFASE